MVIYLYKELLLLMTLLTETLYLQLEVTELQHLVCNQQVILLQKVQRYLDYN